MRNKNVQSEEFTLEKIIFEDEIALYWDKQWELKETAKYRILVNTVSVGMTDKTHFVLKKLTPESGYHVVIERLDEADGVVEILFDEFLKTSKARRRIDVTKAPYNAVGDGKTLNTAALQKAIDDCKTGETVYIPQGTFLSGALKLHSDMELYVEEGALLQGTAAVKDYLPKIKSRFEGLNWNCYAALLNMGELDENNYGFTCENVVIRGGGKIYGGGKALMDAVIEEEKILLKDFLEKNAEYVQSCDNPNVIPARARPRLINISNCRNVIIANMDMGHGAAWNVHFVYSKDIVTYGCKISSKGVWNGDGWNPDSSENCTIFDTTFDSHDDAIAIKSGRNPEGNVIKRPTRNVRVFDCRGTRGVSIGSELSGGIENVYMWDCVLNAGGGFFLKTMEKRGGYVHNVKVKDCQLGMIHITTRYGCNKDGEPAGTLTDVKDLYFENVESFGWTTNYATFAFFDVSALIVIGFDDPERRFRNVTFKNVRLRQSQDRNCETVQIRNVENLTLENVHTYVGN